jgi:polyhydroxyalkanoate synthesis repressor PhaR
MAEAGGKDPTVIKKYANRRLYHTGASSYVTLEDLAEMVRKGEDFIVNDAKTGDDITRSVLTQIIFEQENKGQFLLPITFLRQLIQFYGDSMQGLVPRYLEFSFGQFMTDQVKLREQMSKGFGPTPMAMLEEQTRRNMAVFQEAMRAFSGFGGMPSAATEAPAEEKPAPKKPKV